MWAWQLWLSPRPSQRTRNNGQSSFPHLGDAALYEPLSRPDGRWYVRETHYIGNSLVRAGLTAPPPCKCDQNRESPVARQRNLMGWDDRHIHRRQDEYFKVEQGVLGVVTNGVEHAVTKDDGIFHIPAGTRFVYPSDTRDNSPTLSHCPPLHPYPPPFIYTLPLSLYLRVSPLAD